MTMRLIESKDLERFLTEDSAVKVIGTGVYNGQTYREIKVTDNSRNFTIELRVFDLRDGGVQLPMNFANSGLGL